MIIDTHTHITRRPNSKFAESFEKNVDLMLEEMKSAGVDTSLVIAWAGKDNESRPSTRQLINLTEGKSQLRVVAGVDMMNWQAEDLVELEGYLDKKQIVGVKFYTGYQHFYPSDERCLLIYKLCMKYNVPVIFHSGDTLAGVVPNPKLKYSHPLHVDEVAADHPELKIVIAHMGNPWLVDCAEILYKNPNVYADVSGLVVEDELETPYGEMMRGRIRELIQYVGSDYGSFKLMYGTDWPLCHMDIYVKFAKSLDLNKEQSDMLFFKNAQKVFCI